MKPYTASHLSILHIESHVLSHRYNQPPPQPIFWPSNQSHPWPPILWLHALLHMYVFICWMVVCVWWECWGLLFSLLSSKWCQLLKIYLHSNDVFHGKIFHDIWELKKMLPLLLQHRSSSLLCARDKFNITIKETDKQNKTELLVLNTWLYQIQTIRQLYICYILSIQP